MSSLQQLVSDQLAHLQPQFDLSLAPLSYFKIGGPAEVFIEADTREKIIEIVSFCHQHHTPFKILAGASNVIISSNGVVGITVSLTNSDYQIIEQKDQKTLISVGSGFKTALLVRKTIDDGLSGLEYYLGVPGKVGGAVYNNAHYNEHLIGEYVHRVEVIQPDNQIAWLNQDECGFRYDFSRFQQSKDVILQIEFLLPHGNKDESLALVREATLHRAQTQPLGQPSSGCYFQNIPNTPQLRQQFPQFSERSEFPSAFLIDQAGLKKTRVGGVEVSEKHAAFFVNTGNGTSDEVKQLASIVKQKVKDQFGIELHEEVFFLE